MADDEASNGGRAAGRITRDPEVVAMTNIVGILNAQTAEARVRILRYITHRYEAELPQVTTG